MASRESGLATAPEPAWTGGRPGLPLAEDFVLLQRPKGFSERVEAYSDDVSKKRAYPNSSAAPHARTAPAARWSCSTTTSAAARISAARARLVSPGRASMAKRGGVVLPPNAGERAFLRSAVPQALRLGLVERHLARDRPLVGGRPLGRRAAHAPRRRGLGRRRQRRLGSMHRAEAHPGVRQEPRGHEG